MNAMERYKGCRAKGVPLVAIVTADPAATIRRLVAVEIKNNEAIANNGGKLTQSRVLCWDAFRGMHDAEGMACGLDKYLLKGMKAAPDGTIPDPTRFNVRALLDVLGRVAAPGDKNPPPMLPDRAVAVIHGAGDLFDLDRQQGGIIKQGVWNLRDIFKANGRTAVLLVESEASIPAGLRSDVEILDEPAPTDEQLASIVDSVASDAAKASKAFKLSATDRGAASIRLAGLLSAFSAEQTVSLSCNRDGLDLDGLWESARQRINRTKGLSVYAGKERFSDIGGVANVKRFLRAVIDGRDAPRTIVFIDEIEKALAGAHGDSSGVSQGFLQSFLTEMQDTKATGCIFIGPPGAAKSAVAKATGNEAGILTVALDANGMKGSLVGESEKAMRDALKVVRTVSGGKALWIATCNSIDSLPIELRRRFTFGTFFFDLPDAEEREAIWQIYLGRYGLDGTERPDCAGWTGSEIERCCDLSWRLGLPLTEAADFIVPVSVSAAGQIENLRNQADGRYTSASYRGVFRQSGPALESCGAAGGRAMSLE